MLPLSTELVELERRKQLLRESEEERLIRGARPLSKRPSLARRLAVVAGAYLVNLGSKMLTYGAVATVKRDKRGTLAVLSYGYRLECPSARYLDSGRPVSAGWGKSNGSITLWSRR